MKIPAILTHYFSKPKYFEIDHCSNYPAETYSQLLNAEEIISNFAKANKFKVRFYGIDDFVPRANECVDAQYMSTKVGVTITKSNKQRLDTIIPYSKEDEVPFLRRVYQFLDSAAIKKEPRIDTHKGNILERLLLKFARIIRK